MTRIIFMGSSYFAVPSLEGLIRSPYQVVAVYTQPDRPSGRGRSLAFSPVKELALKHGLPVVQPESLKEASVINQLDALAPEMIIVAAYGKLLPKEVLTLPKFGCLNIHPSLLPRHRGPSPVASAILLGDEVTGVTIMLMDVGLDTGPILSQEKCSISPQDTTGSLTIRLAEIGAALLLKTLPLWLEGKLKPQPQKESDATYSRIMTKADGKINWCLSAKEIWLRVRAFNPWPGAYTFWGDKLLKITQAVPISTERATEPGKVVSLLPYLTGGREDIVVGVETGDGILGLCRVQLEGKKDMPALDFIRGQRSFVGEVLTGS